MSQSPAPPRRLSRSPSASSFGPGRRSLPNLQHLSLAPLAPKYPIESSEPVSPYFASHTAAAAAAAAAAAELHTPASIAHVSALPSPDGILGTSPASSRANSRPRLKKKRSRNLPDSGEAADRAAAPSGALTSHGFGHAGLRHGHSHSHSHGHGADRLPVSRSQLQLRTDSDWLVQTGLTLTASSRENKGQSWIVQRNSTTSLVSLHAVSVDESAARPPLRSVQTSSAHAQSQAPLLGGGGGGGSRPGSRPASRAGSRAASRTRRSRRDLAMTSVVDPSSTHVAPLAAPRFSSSSDEDVRPDWADPEARAEIAARAAAELAEDHAFDHDDGGDPYATLNFEGHFDIDLDSEDEREVRRQLLAGHRGWFDGVFDVLLRLPDDGHDVAAELGDETLDRPAADGLRPRRGEGVSLDTVVLTTQDRQRGPRAVQPRRHEDEVLTDDQVEAPPEQPQSLWEDVKWFGRLLAKTVQ